MILHKKPSSIYIAIEVTDMRKSINGLTQIVQEEFDLELFSGNYFAFCNKRRDLIKILYWDENGFCIWLKRLESDRFCWPESEQEVLEVSNSALEWLLHGLDVQQAHQRLNYNEI
jgi:transposase